MTLQERALQIAITQLGEQEKPLGSNWGEPVKTYLHSVGIDFPAAWCYALQYWCFDKAATELNVANPLVKTGGVLAAWNKADHKYRVVGEPQPGDIFIMDLGHGLGHCGTVEVVEKDVVHTVDGNTNNNGSREGVEVERKIRNRNKIIGYLRYI